MDPPSALQGARAAAVKTRFLSSWHLPLREDIKNGPGPKIPHEITASTSMRPVLIMVTYRRMVLDSNEVSVHYNFAAAVLSWFLLAGLFVLPATFTSLAIDNKIVNHLIGLPIGISCFAVGTAGIGALWLRFRKNYVWLLSHLFLYVTTLTKIYRGIANSQDLGC